MIDNQMAGKFYCRPIDWEKLKKEARETIEQSLFIEGNASENRDEIVEEIYQGWLKAQAQILGMENKQPKD